MVMNLQNKNETILVVQYPITQFSTSKKDLEEITRKVARIVGVNPDLAYQLVKKESNFNPSAVSSEGALGLTQIMPRTLQFMQSSTVVDKEVVKLAGKYNHQIVCTWNDPFYNLYMGLGYYKYLKNSYCSDSLTLIIYNAGHYWYQNKIPPPKSAVRYADMILCELEK